MMIETSGGTGFVVVISENGLSTAKTPLDWSKSCLTCRFWAVKTKRLKGTQELNLLL
jgi:predicted RecB family nuclease